MAKQNRSRPGQNKRAAARAAAAAPYDKSKPRAKPTKPTVQVTYEGAPKTAKPKPKVVAKAAEIRARDEAKKEEKRERRKEKKREAKAEGKGKGKAVVEESDEEEDEDEDEDDIEVEGDAEVDVATRPAVDASSSTFKIVAGTYEKLLYGLEGRYAPGATKPTLEPIFIFPAHLATVKAVAASPGGKWLATGSEDEFVKVWDLRRRKEVGSLSQHTGSITSLTFPTPSHLLTTSDDATLSLFRTSDWALLKSLKGHSGRVNNVDVHPTGRVALSVGKDQTLKMWDLMRGRGAASLALGSEAELVKFSPRGTHFAVLYPKKVEIYSLTLKLLHTLETKFRFNALVFADLPHPEDDDDEDATEVLCIGTEKGVVEVYRVSLGEAEEVEEEKDEDEDEDSDEAMDADAETSKSSAVVQRIATLSGHTNRIKSISTLRFAAPHGPTVLLTTVSSDGLINLYDLADVDVPDSDEDKEEVEAQVEEIEPVASYDTKASRLICVTLADGPVPRASKLVAGVKAKEATGRRATFAVPDEEDEEDDDDDEDEDGDMYENSDDEEEDGMEIEFEDEEEEEEEDEGEYEDE